MTDETKKSDQAPRVAVLTPELQEPQAPQAPQDPASKQTDLQKAADAEANEPRAAEDRAADRRLRARACEQLAAHQRGVGGDQGASGGLIQ